ncbi:glycosyltransferase family 4 protein [bacterium]|nr:glycosyltransferase family 4 protein [bacterium]
MNRTRIALVTSRFWPISGISQIVSGELAVGLAHQGCEVEIITSRWEHNWSKLFNYRGVTVNRLPISSSGPWGNFRTQRALTRQLNRNWDAAVICGVDDHFEPSVRVLAKTDTRIVLRLDDSVAPMELWAQKVNRKMIAALESVDNIVCTNSNLRDRLLAIGVDRNKIHIIADGVPSNDHEGKIGREKSPFRVALSDAHPVLAIEPDEPLVVTGIPLNGDAGIHDLIQGWKLVARRHPRSRLWVIGDGSQGRAIWEQITESNLVYSIIMPGFFDCVDDLFMAADVYVNPARDVTGHACLTRAMACGVCPISTDNIDGLIENDVNGVLVARQDSAQFSNAILSLMEDRDRLERLSQAARDTVSRELPFQNTITQYQKLVHPISDKSSCESTS